MKNKLFVALGAGILIVCAPLVAHHGTSVTYQVEKTVTMNGTVTEFSFSYPHPQLYFDVKDDQVTITCNPHKLSTATACLVKELVINGKKLPLGGGGPGQEKQ